MTNAITTVHRSKPDRSTGIITVTTWHNTKAEAAKRAGKGGRVFSGGCLGNFRAVTWER